MSPSKRNDDDESDDAEASEDEKSVHSSEQESNDDDDSDDDDSDDDDFEKAASKKKTTTKKTTTAAKPRRKTKVATGRSPANPRGSSKSSKSTKRGGRGRGTAKSAAQRAAHHALATLAKNVLQPGETPGLSSLVAGLLHSYRPTKEHVELGDIPQVSEYTPNLVALAKKVISVHNDHPNRAQLALLNLLFRSVGGGPDTDLSMGLNTSKKSKKSSKGDELDSEMGSDTEMEDNEEDEDEEVILDEMDTDEWARVVTDLVDDMRHVPNTQILICADPQGAVHQMHDYTEKEKKAKEGDNYVPTKLDDRKKLPASVGAIEYRKIYQEFWYVLGHVALTEGGMATTSNNDFESQSDEDKEESIVRLDAELIKGVLLRIIELSPVGQPDVRAAATLASLSIAHAVLDQSAMLVKKMDVASRQYAAAKKNTSPGGGTKAEALKVRMESLKRSVEDLEEVVLGPVVQGLFVHRYR